MSEGFFTALGAAIGALATVLGSGMTVIVSRRFEVRRDAEAKRGVRTNICALLLEARQMIKTVRSDGYYIESKFGPRIRRLRARLEGADVPLSLDIRQYYLSLAAATELEFALTNVPAREFSDDPEHLRLEAAVGLTNDALVSLERALKAFKLADLNSSKAPDDGDESDPIDVNDAW